MVTDEQQYFYGIRDVQDGSTVTQRMLVDQTSRPSEINNARGWYVTLWGNAGERVTEQAVVVAENVIFTSFSPSRSLPVTSQSFTQFSRIMNESVSRYST